ncbi:alanyl-tRNA synthetase [Peribacillus deserti]|uniref:Alanyl-tRNA synthetase n=1 Tax=Peribacillus deserti TaxID=673318 RepID=A0ABS2QMB4_9BACI|nr:alanine--tRNA ligase-related protein [Peribacillus deserti]MBM7693386.1 alanyl-tRNA synthetase [Peribacillus deserti]
MTKKLFYSDPGLSEWSTRITSIREKDDHFLVMLEETAFYPEGGGQPADHGFIDDVQVLDVIEEGSNILHKVKLPLELKEVSCRLDKERRLDHTQHHSGQHLLSAVCIELFDAPTLSFHLGKETVTIDCDISELHTEQLMQIENRANQYIWENRKIKTFHVTHSELTKLPLRKLPKVTEDIRIVDISGIDVSACCGTHVESTAQIGILKIIKTEKQRGKTRLHFMCGIRALTYFQDIHSQISSLASKFSSSSKGISAKVDKLEADMAVLQKELENTKMENQYFTAEKIISEHTGSYIECPFDFPIKEMQSMGRILAEKSGKPALLYNLNEFRLIAAMPASSGFLCGKWFKENLRDYNGKGGGSDTLAQASFPSPKDMTQFIQLLKEKLFS